MSHPELHWHEVDPQYEALQWEMEQEPSDDNDNDDDSADDPAFYDNVFWRDPIPNIDFNERSSVNVSLAKKRSTRRRIKEAENVGSTAALVNKVVAVATERATVVDAGVPTLNGNPGSGNTTTIIHVHHYYPAPIAAPVSPPPPPVQAVTVSNEVTLKVEPQPPSSTLVESTTILNTFITQTPSPNPPPKDTPTVPRVVLVPFEDSWVTKEEHARLTHQRELEARDKDLIAERERVQHLQHTVNAQKRAIMELQSTSTPLQPPPRQHSAYQAPSMIAPISIQDIGPISTVPPAAAQTGYGRAGMDGLNSSAPLHITTSQQRGFIPIEYTSNAHQQPIVTSPTTVINNVIQVPPHPAPPAFFSQGPPHYPSPPAMQRGNHQFISSYSPATSPSSQTPAITPITESTSTRSTILSPPLSQSPIQQRLQDPPLWTRTNTDTILSTPLSLTTSEATLNLQESLDDLLSDKKPRVSKQRDSVDVSMSTLRHRVQSLLTLSPESGTTDPKKKTGDKEVFGKDTSNISKTITRFFRYFNLARSVATCTFSVYTTVKQINDPFTIALKAQGLMIALIFFNILDVVVSFIKAFPKVLWFFWKVKDWDPLIKIYSIWAVIADHELLTDIGPVLINVILKIYTYRLDEIKANPNAQSTIFSTKVSLDNFNDPELNNYVQLIMFGITTLYLILFHAGRLFRVLAFDKKAPILATLVVLKTLLLCWDILTNSLLLYEVLVSRGLTLFHHSHTTNFMLSVAIPSPLVTLTTNALLNLPLHYFFLRMQLTGIAETAAGRAAIAGGSNAALAAREVIKEVEGVHWMRVFWSALRKTFHPLISAIFGTYAIYALSALLSVLTDLRYLDPSAGLSGNAGLFLPDSTFFGWSSTNATTATVDRRNIVSGIVWINVVANYAVGAVAGVAYWVFGVLAPGVLGGVRGVKWFERRVSRNGKGDA